MIDLTQLVTDAGASLPAGWSVEWAWTMAPIEAEEISGKVPFLTLYQGSETFAARMGTPCFQTALFSAVIAVTLCHKAELSARLFESRKALLGWQASPNDQNAKLFMSHTPDACGPVQIKGEYIWWQDTYLTTYPLVFN